MGSPVFLARNDLKLIRNISFLVRSKTFLISNGLFLVRNRLLLTRSVAFLTRNGLLLVRNGSFLIRKIAIRLGSLLEFASSQRLLRDCSKQLGGSRVQKSKASTVSSTISPFVM